MMSLGIITAMMDEAVTLAPHPLPAGPVRNITKDVNLVISGIGPGRARRAAEQLLEAGASGLVSWGIASGLNPEILPGTLVIPRKIIDARGNAFFTDEDWSDELGRRLAPSILVNRGVIAESTEVSDDKKKSDLFNRTGADAADMESAAVASAAAQASIPFVAIRAVADIFDMNIPRGALESIDEFGRVCFTKLASNVCISELPALFRLHRNFQAAKRTLQKVAAKSGELFCFAPK